MNMLIVQHSSNLFELRRGVLTYTQDAIRDEPLLLDCGYEAARRLGGPLMQTFLDRLQYELRHGIVRDRWDITLGTFDCHGQLLFDGVYPCIPGWHHDSVDREGQIPIYDEALNPQRHFQYSLLANATLAPTEFLPCVTACTIPDSKEVGAVTAAIVKSGQKAEIENKAVFLADNTIYGYDDRVLHRGTRTKGFGWRWFVRAAFHYRRGRQEHRDTPHMNQKRNQVQVYIDKDFKGW